MVCECNSTEHIVIFQVVDGYEDEIDVEIHLTPRPFFERIWYGLKYIFGYRCKFGDFDEILLDKNKLKELLKSLDY